MRVSPKPTTVSGRLAITRTGRGRRPPGCKRHRPRTRRTARRRLPQRPSSAKHNPSRRMITGSLPHGDGVGRLDAARAHSSRPVLCRDLLLRGHRERRGSPCRPDFTRHHGHDGIMAAGGAGTVAGARDASTTVLPILLAVSAGHFVNDTMQSALLSIYPLIKEPP